MPFKDPEKAKQWAKDYVKTEHGLAVRRKAGNKWYHGNALGVRKYQYRKNYNITLDDYDRLAEKQAGLCAICKLPPGEKGRTSLLHVDHDHATNEVRGLLCDNCNRALGLFQESINNLECAVDYLKSYWRGYIKSR